MTLKVIGVGLGQTGTHSLCAALEKLGYANCFHADGMLNAGNLRAARGWLDIALDRAERWDDIFEGFQAIASFPAWALYDKLMQRYPDARVILTIRDPEEWFKDINAADYAAFKGDPWWIFWLSPVKRTMRQLEQLLILDRKYGGRLHDRKHAIDVFEAHTREIKRVVPPDKLLIYNVEQGWRPLCDFLNVPEPKDEPFPWLNDIPSVKKRLRHRFIVYRSIEAAVVASVLALALVIGL